MDSSNLFNRSAPTMNQIYFLTLTALTFSLGWCQDRVPYSWLPEDLPNPQLRPRDCGLGSEPGFVCDPNGILTRHQLETLNWFLTGIAETTNPDYHPCSRYHFEHLSEPSFYKVSIALVPSVRLTRDTNGVETKPLEQAQIFAYRLEHDLWNISSCEEDVVILYSRDDKALVTTVGSTAGRRLTSRARSFIHGIVGEHFAEGRINEGLLRMVYEIELVLNGNTYFDDIMSQPQVGSSGPFFMALPFLFYILLSWIVYTSQQ